ncbi:MAG: hypothetical protein PHE50_00395 [Dehalococcoidales bacterium]|nr:hypothetical protein [Dehalococcoidales bacterium]
MPDTEDQDSAAEVFWPEGYKLVIRENAPLIIKNTLLKEKPFTAVYARDYTLKYADYPLFIDKLAEMVAISLENGADNAFDDIINSFLKEAPLPPLRVYKHYFPAAILPSDFQKSLSAVIIDEYSQDNIYVYAYGVGYKKTFLIFDDYIKRISELVITGAQNAANDALENIYRNLYLQAPLSPLRRHPRRLKVW